jgi:uncharacterized membrane protein YgdD (TMEM256/DUF423 family)
MDRTFVALAALSGFLGVALGAFGAHALRASLEPRDLEIFETAVRYQLVHAVALLGVGILWARWSSTALTASGWLLIAGTVIFSGSLYLLVFTGARWLGAVTPLGGAAFLLGWLALAWAAVKGAGGAG